MVAPPLAMPLATCFATVARASARKTSTPDLSVMAAPPTFTKRETPPFSTSVDIETYTTVAVHPTQGQKKSYSRVAMHVRLCRRLTQDVSKQCCVRPPIQTHRRSRWQRQLHHRDYDHLLQLQSQAESQSLPPETKRDVPTAMRNKRNVSRRPVVRRTRPPTCEIVCVGEEILAGDIVDTNSKFLAKSFPALGMRLTHTHHVSDNLSYLSSVIHTCLHRCDVLFVVGGLGPTVDDITREAVADAVSEKAELRVDSALQHQLEEFWKDLMSRSANMRTREMPQNNLKQAMLIPSAVSVRNHVGTAPGWLVSLPEFPTRPTNSAQDTESATTLQVTQPTHVSALERGLSVQDAEEEAVFEASRPRWIAVMPGPPGELAHMHETEVLPALQKIVNDHFVASSVFTRVIKTAGVGESHMEELISDLVQPNADSSLEVGIYHNREGVQVKLCARAATLQDAQRMVREREEQVVARLEPYIWGFDGDTLAAAVCRELKRTRRSLAVVEGVSGGRLADTLTTELRELSSAKASDSTSDSTSLRGARVAKSFNPFRYGSVMHADHPETLEGTITRAQRLCKDKGVNVAVVVSHAWRQIDETQSSTAPGTTHISVVVDGVESNRTYSFLQSAEADKTRAVLVALTTLRKALLTAKTQAERKAEEEAAVV